MGINIINESKFPKIEVVEEDGVFIDGTRLNGVTSYFIGSVASEKSSVMITELSIKLVVK